MLEKDRQEQFSDERHRGTAENEVTKEPIREPAPVHENERFARSAPAGVNVSRARRSVPSLVTRAVARCAWQVPARPCHEAGRGDRTIRALDFLLRPGTSGAFSQCAEREPRLQAGRLPRRGSWTLTCRKSGRLVNNVTASSC
jgi:hypothetical protein